MWPITKLGDHTSYIIYVNAIYIIITKTFGMLQQRWETTITMTRFNLHPLETLSRDALSCLQAYEKVNDDKLYPRTSNADKIQLAIDKWRYCGSSSETS